MARVKNSRLRIFIGSSSEHKDVAEKIQAQLERDQNLDPKVWDKRTFKLSESYIESLENEMGCADFAVLALTPDDITNFRGGETNTPRDNVLFELGLFMGSLSRERCYGLVETNLKLPSDLLGVKFAKYDSRDWKTLKKACMEIADRANNLGVRPKLGKRDLSEYEEIRELCERISGSWWDYITNQDNKDEIALSFIQIYPQPITNTVQIDGQVFNKKGDSIASWNCVAARIKKDKGKIVVDYSWEGDRVKSQGGKFMGFGHMRFDEDVGEIYSGSGKFIDLPENSPKGTQWKHFELRRSTKTEVIQTMKEGSKREKKSLVKTLYNRW